MDLDSKENLWLIDQLNKCRCCFDHFDHNKKQVEITDIIENQFLELTQIELKTSPNFSNKVCVKCTEELQSISSFRSNLITKQHQLYEFVILSPYQIEDVIIPANFIEPVDVEVETQFTDQFEILHSDSDCEVIENPEVLSETTKTNDLQSTIRSNLITKQQHLYDFVITRQFMIQDSIHLLNNNIETQSSANDKNNKEKRIEIPEASVTSKTKETKDYPSLKKGYSLRKQKTHEAKANTKLLTKVNKVRKTLLDEKMKQNILRKHKLTIDPDIDCEVCGKKFYTLSKLKIHSIYHKDPQFICSFDGCTRKYFQYCNVQYHEKTHIKTHLNQRNKSRIN